ncbi:hypothetical protein [Spirillospora albida]|uniref:hypothetical protein n=1 Tax=Spirillospora albida TaxID=58123 RepID=UPI0012F7D6CE|nr:hypothetical protein [Spirillospora albida]
MTEKIVRRCRRAWRRIGVSRDDAADMAAELTADLEAAEADGRDAQSYVGGDPAGFARAWASERGVVPLRPRIGRLVTAAVLGGVPGGLAGLFVAFGLSSDAMAEVLGERDVPTALIMGLYVLCGVFAWAGVLAGGSAVLRYHADAARRTTVLALAVALPPAGAAAAAATMLLARRVGYAYDPTYFALEVATPVLVMAGTVALTRLLVIYLSNRGRGRRPVPETRSAPPLQRSSSDPSTG